ncbi:hypothetical protein, partial [Francisella tularensis]|uniref:hypothetical protein n=1 Tax=Francisella tularensis TaxID=263 RepID=UPI001CC316D1
CCSYYTLYYSVRSSKVFTLIFCYTLFHSFKYSIDTVERSAAYFLFIVGTHYLTWHSLVASLLNSLVFDQREPILAPEALLC